MVGLKPTVGLLSRTGIVPISSTLDTPGPMTKNITDNWIFLLAMLGRDTADAKSFEFDKNKLADIKDDLKEKRLGVFTSLLQDSVYQANINTIKEAGGELVELTPPPANLSGFLTLLNIDMKNDLPQYLKDHTDSQITVGSVKDIIDFNLKDTLLSAPYGQGRFEGIVADTTTMEQLQVIKENLMTGTREYFKALESESLDAILSINNYHAAYSAVAEYPNLTVPMGYKKSGEPISLTFIGLPKTEGKLLQLGYAFEQLTKHRKLPDNYK